MSPELGVFFGERRVGQLRRQPGGRPAFEYDRDWLADDRAFAVSISLPLRPGLAEGVAAHAFFANLLPEGPVRAAVARQLGISSDNDFALLERIGGECAGALSILPDGARPGPGAGAYEPLAAADVAAMARRFNVLAAAAGRGNTRLSLAGAQDKLPVKRDEDGSLWLPTGGAPSTHILKVPSRDFKHLPANEVLVTHLARVLGLVTVEVELAFFEGTAIAVVRRYDRVAEEGGSIARLHQEDLCQALGLMPSTKYENEGGPGAAAAMKTVQRWSVAPLSDAQQLLRWLIFGLLAGNADGHGKNLSLLHATRRGAGGARPRLAPFYDLVCTRAYPRIDRQLAMSVGGQRDPGLIGRAQWEALAGELAIGAGVVLRELERMASAMPSALDELAEADRAAHGESPVVQRVRQVVRRQCRRSLRLSR